MFLLLVAPLTLRSASDRRSAALRRRMGVEEGRAGARPIAGSASPRGLLEHLQRLRPSLVAVAQRELDAWTPDEEGEDAELGQGGPCDRIAQAMAGVLAQAGIDTTEGGHPGDDHAWLIAYTRTEAAGVDIPSSRYERGGGYAWTKIPGVVLQPQDVVTWPLARTDLDVDREG